jgi:hypothetical protein
MVLIVLSLLPVLPCSAADEKIASKLSASLTKDFGDSKCSIVDEKPWFTASRGGYMFEVKSARGNDCRLYYLRNKPGSTKTPVHWLDDRETFFDGVLAPCRANSTCPIIEVSRDALQASGGPTVLNYGPNKDEFTDKPNAFRESSLMAKNDSHRYVTIVRGTLASSRTDALIPVGIRLASFVEGERRPFKFTYELTTLPKDAPIRIVRFLSEGTSSETVLVWPAAASKPFFDALRGNEAVLRAERGKVSVSFEANEVFADATNTMVLYRAGERLLTITAPAYRPGSF